MPRMRARGSGHDDEAVAARDAHPGASTSTSAAVSSRRRSSLKPGTLRRKKACVMFVPHSTEARLDSTAERGYSKRMRWLAPVAFAILAGCQPPPVRPGVAPAPAQPPAVAVAATAAEPHLSNLRMLTNGGENAEAYFSADGRRLIFQATRP